MPLMPIPVFAAASVAQADTSRTFLVWSTDTAETEHSSPNVPCFPNAAVVWVKCSYPCFKYRAVLRETGAQSPWGELGSLEGDHPSTWYEVEALWWGR